MERRYDRWKRGWQLGVLGWLLLLVPICLIAVRFVRLAPVVPLALWVLIPPTMNDVMVGGPGFHLATYAILLILAFLVLGRGKEIGAELRANGWLYLLLVLIVVSFGVATALSTADTSIIVFANQVLAPVLLFLIVRTVTRVDGQAHLFMIYAYIALALVEAIVAIGQFVTKDFGFYAQFFEHEKWWSGSYYRSVGTMNHFLTLGLVCASAVPLVKVFRSGVLRATALLMLLAGVAYSQSRFALVCAGIGAVYVLLTAGTHPVRRLTAIVAAGVGLGIGWSLGVLEPVLGRFDNDASSSQLRQIAYDWFWNRWSDYLVSVEGMGYSFSVSNNAGLSTSFESAFIMYSIDFGVVGATLYFGTMVLLLVLSNRAPFVRLSGAIAIVLPMAFSSLAIDSAAGCVLWYLVAIGSGLQAFQRKRAQTTVSTYADGAHSLWRSAVR